MNNHCLLFTLFVIFVCTSFAQGYHWRTWNGTVPHDAVVGAVDARGNSYIAKALLPTHGLYVGQVFAGQTEIPICWDTVAIKREYATTIEVLCSNTNDLVWIGSNKTTTRNILEQGLADPVVGGISSEYDMNEVYIGRITAGTSYVYIGSVHTDLSLYWVSEWTYPGSNAAGYELLVSTEARPLNSEDLRKMHVAVDKAPQVQPEGV